MPVDLFLLRVTVCFVRRIQRSYLNTKQKRVFVGGACIGVVLLKKQRLNKKNVYSVFCFTLFVWCAEASDGSPSGAASEAAMSNACRV